MILQIKLYNFLICISNKYINNLDKSLIKIIVLRFLKKIQFKSSILLKKEKATTSFYGKYVKAGYEFLKVKKIHIKHTNLNTYEHIFQIISFAFLFKQYVKMQDTRC